MSRDSGNEPGNADLTSALRQIHEFMVSQAAGAGDRPRDIDRFLKRNPPKFHGGYDPDGAYAWILDVEQIFESVICTETSKVTCVNSLLTGEARNWWNEAKVRLAQPNVELGWAAFRRAFLEKYFPDDVKGNKETEFLNLKQGNMTVAKYTIKFNELSQFYPPYQTAPDESSKCIKF